MTNDPDGDAGDDTDDNDGGDDSNGDSMKMVMVERFLKLAPLLACASAGRFI